MQWIEQEGKTAISVIHLARTRLASQLTVKLAVVCGNAVPTERHREMATAVKLGLETGCRFLLHGHRNVSDEKLWRGLFAIHYYWEPATAQCTPLWPRVYSRRYSINQCLRSLVLRNAAPVFFTDFTSPCSKACADTDASRELVPVRRCCQASDGCNGRHYRRSR